MLSVRSSTFFSRNVSVARLSVSTSEASPLAADSCVVNYFFTLPPTIFSQVPSGT